MEWEIAEAALLASEPEPRAHPPNPTSESTYLPPDILAPWLDEGSEEISLGCDLKELRKEDLVLYGGRGGRHWRGGRRWLGGSLLAIGQGFVLLAVGGDVLCAGSRHIPKVLAAEGGSARRELRAMRKRFTRTGLLWQIF